MRSLFVLLFALGISLAGCAPPTPEQNAITALYNTMTPHYTHWREASASFSDTSNHFCNDKNTLAEVRNSWQQAMLAWTAIQAFPVGPVTDKNYASQITYWPDAKNLVAFQVEARLKNNTHTPVSTSSVALRGLSAAEYILFDTGHDLNQPAIRQQYCPLLTEISSYQVQLSSSIEKEWQQLAKNTRSFPNARFANEHEVLTEFLRVQVTVIDNLGKRLEEPFKAGRVQVYQLEYWRSGLSQASLHNTATTAKSLWQNGWRPLAAAKDEDLVTSIDQTYMVLLSKLSADSPVPLSTVITTAEGIAWVRNRQSEVHMLDVLQGRTLAKTLGIQIGFNANDGD